jgi:hypothetical protein
VTWFARRRAPKPGLLRTADRADLEHLRSFAASRSGVEGYWEPRTAVTEATLVLVAADGEWTRRRIGGQHEAEQFARSLAMPLYEAARVGYPQRMRDATTRRAKAARDANAAGGGPADS